MRVTPPGRPVGARSNDLAAVHFADRVPEARAFQSALRAFRRRLDGDDDGEGCRNVVTFFGAGGVGKTALSRRLESWSKRDLPLINGWGPPPDTPVATTARIDLHDSSGQLDVLDVLLTLRRSLGQVRRTWGTFDLALAAYWSARHPAGGDPDLSGRPETADAVTETVSNLLQDLGVKATGAGLGVRAVSLAVGELRRRHALKRHEEAFPGFVDFLDDCLTLPGPMDQRPDIACRIAGLAAWELSRLQPVPLVVVFVDTAERLRLDPRRTAEQHLNELVTHLRNVLFVVSGRRALDWHEDTRTYLPYRGRASWPELAPVDDAPSNQHRVGYLPVSDRVATLRAVRDQESLPLDDRLIDDISSASGGLPQYLDLVIQVARTAKNRGETVTPAHVTGSVDALVLRVLSDIPGDEQRAIRAACLFHAFEPGFVARVAGVDEGVAARAALQPVVEPSHNPRLPFRIHDEIRRAIRQAGVDVPGGWSHQDWENAGRRALEEVRLRHDEFKKVFDEAGHGGSSVLEAIAAAVTIVCEVPVLPGPAVSENYRDWLSQAIVYGPSVAGLRPLVAGRSETPYGQGVLDFIAGKSVDLPVKERLQALRGVFDSDHALSLPAGRHLSYELRNQSRWAESLVVVEELVQRKDSALHRRQRAIILSMARRFRDAVQAEAAEGRPVPGRAIEYAHGNPETYFAQIDAKVSKLGSQSRMREVLEDRSDLALRRAFFGGVVRQDVDAIQAEAEAVGHSIALRASLAARVLMGWLSDDDTESALSWIRRLDESRLDGAIGYRFALSETLHALVLGDRERVSRLALRIADRPQDRSRAWIPLEFFLEWAGFRLPPTPTQWLEPVEVVRDRWVGHLQAFLARRDARIR